MLKNNSTLESAIMSSDAVVAVKHKTNLSEAIISDIMRNSMRLYGVMQGELMEPYLHVATKFVRDLDNDYLLGIGDDAQIETRFISTVA
jgi:hypothetical protein